MTFYDFLSAHPIVTVFLALIAANLIGLPFRLLFRIANRWIRHRNILTVGWPPEHCDADGDLRQVED